MPAGTGTDALFVLPPGGATPRFSEHLGAAFLRAVLARAGVRAEQYLPERRPSLTTFARFLSEARPRIVGFTAYETNLRACRALAGVVRETLPDAVVLVGGPNATFSPEETLALVPGDLCLRGAGEGSIAAIAGAILGGARPRPRLGELLADVPNLVLRTGDGPWRTRAGDLSSFPGEVFRHLDDLPSPYAAGLVRTPEVGILTARGCNQHCTYCSFATISARRIHYHGVERVLDDLAAFKAVVDRAERRPRAVLVCDDAFTLAPRRARAICEGIVARGLELPFQCETRADRVDLDLLRLMRRAGFVSVAFGLESAVPRVLRAVGKVRPPATRADPDLEAERAYLEAVRRAVADAKRAGLSPAVSVIGGLPGDTEEGFRATLAFVEALGVRTYAHNVLTLLPGTPLHRDRARHGLDAGRDAASGEWRTSHAYDVSAVPPLANAMDRLNAWAEANELSDALCGIPRRPDADDGAAWAVVLHRGAPDAGVAAWLREVIAVHGAVVVVGETEGGAATDASWAEALTRGDVPYGLLAVLSRADGPRGRHAGTSLRTAAGHRFEVRRRWGPAGRVAVDEVGRCRVPLWIASRAAAPPRGTATAGPFAPTPQIADGCRWWSGGRRCSHPRVLHAWPDGAVTPCWGGPRIGTIGDAYPALLARARALRGRPGRGAPSPDRCPLAGDGAGGSDPRAAGEREVASQMQWVLFAKYGAGA